METERLALSINSCRPCQPAGAVYAAMGVHACLPLSHGSPGCIRFHRALLQNHFRKPVKAVTSVLKEEAAVFGGEENLRTAVRNAFEIYNPEVLAVHTTCLSETIGDDVGAILASIPVPAGKHLVWASTPSYTDGCISGYAAMLCGFIEGIAEPSHERTDKLCVFPGMVNTGDLYEIQMILEQFGLEAMFLPDFRGVFDTAAPERADAYAPGGTAAQDIKRIGGCGALLALGSYASWKAGELVGQKFFMQGHMLHLPVGLRNTDRFMETLCRISGKHAPKLLARQREGLMELVVESSKYLFGKRVALYTDPDMAIALAAFLADIGMTPAVVATAQPDEFFEKEMESVYRQYGVQGTAKSGCDAYALGHLAQEGQVDCILGESRGAYLSRELGIPFVRIGFPVTDRFGGYLQTVMGYRGGVRIIEMVTNALLDHLDKRCGVLPKTR